jgi:hypothetical protein
LAFSASTGAGIFVAVEDEELPSETTELETGVGADEADAPLVLLLVPTHEERATTDKKATMATRLVMVLFMESLLKNRFFVFSFYH